MTTRGWSRLLLGAGSFAAIAISPVFALSYFAAYGGVDEAPPGWLADLEPTFVERGWLGGGDPEGLYTAYGRWYFVLLTAAFLGLVVLVRSDFGGRSKRGGWGVVTVGVGLAAAGTLGDYSGIDLLGSLFILELVGALVIAIGTALIGVRLWRSGRRGMASVGLIGPASLVLGSMLLGHFPSGPLLFALLGGVILAIAGTRWSRTPEP